MKLYFFDRHFLIQQIMVAITTKPTIIIAPAPAPPYTAIETVLDSLLAIDGDGTVTIVDGKKQFSFPFTMLHTGSI